MNSHDPGVFVIKGSWGTGKTYLVNEVVEKNRSKWEDRNYAYVSLFGVNSLEELRENIFVGAEAAKPQKDVKIPKILTRNRDVHRLLKWATGRFDMKRHMQTVSDLTSGAGFSGAEIVSRSTKLLTKFWIDKALRNSKIVLDDLERRGSSLSIRDLLGFVSQLKEKNGCQVVIIFNEEQLDCVSQKAFDLDREKVVDREVKLTQEFEKAIEIGFSEAKPHIEQVLQRSGASEVLRQLGADNIRAVQKVMLFLERLQSYLSGINEDTQKRVLRSAIFVSWFFYVRNTSTVPWEFIKDFDSTSLVTKRFLGKRREGKRSPEEEKKERQEEVYSKQLREYGYRNTGLLERSLIGALEQGYTDEKVFSEVLSNLEENIRTDKARQRLGEAWGLYHYSFDNNEQEFVNAIIRCFQEERMYYGPESLESAMKIFEDLGRQEDAKSLLELYFRPPYQPAISTLHISLATIENEVIKHRLKQVNQDFTLAKSVPESIEEILFGNQFDPNNVTILQKYTSDDWYEFFTQELQGDTNLRSYVIRLLEYSRTPNAEGKKVADRVEEALDRIASRSAINRIRIDSLRSQPRR